MDLRASLLWENKPIHQFHDALSLRWIKSHRPTGLPNNYKIPARAISLIEAEKPWGKIRDYWFFEDLIRDGIHGFRHGCRVSMSAASLVIRNHKVSDGVVQAIMFAGLTHDCRRKNDNADPRHGIRSGMWLDKNKHILPRRMRGFLPAMRFAVSVHNESYDRITAMSEYKKFKIFVDVLKTADALDRYRFPRSDWWFSPRFTVLPPMEEDMAFAFDFALENEVLYLRTKENEASILSAWKKLLAKRK